VAEVAKLRALTCDLARSNVRLTSELAAERADRRRTEGALEAAYPGLLSRLMGELNATEEGCDFSC